MINRINNTSSFTSKVNLVYSSNNTYKKVFESKHTQKAIDELLANGNDDVVTLIPDEEQDMNCRIPVLNIRVKEEKDGEILLGTSVIPGASPENIVKEYMHAKNHMNVMRDNPLNDYII